MKREETINKYIIRNKLDIEKMLQDFRGYVYKIIENNAGESLSYEDKEEIMSDVFLTVWHNKEKIDNKRPLKYYMAGIAKNLISNKLRQQKKYNKQIEFKDIELQDLEEIDMVCERNQILKVISEELNNMKPRDYEVFAKYYYYSKSIREIAIELGMSETNVSVRLYRIKKKLKKELEKRGFTYKNLLTIILVLFALTGVALASNIVIKVIKKQFFPDTSAGVDTAIDNGYIQTIESDYVASNEAEIKVTKVLMDDYNLDFELDINLKNTEEQTKANNIVLANFLIVDENENIIAMNCENIENSYERLCELGGIEPNHKGKNYSDGSEYFRVISNIENNYKYVYSTHSNEFPKSKKLKFIFNKLILWNKNMDVIGQIEGEWVIEVELPKEFYERETIIYQVKSCNREDVNLISLEVSQTAAKLHFITKWGDPIYDEDDTLEEIGQKTKKWFERPESLTKLIENDYIMNEDGKKFYRAQSAYDGNMLCSQSITGTLKYYQTYDLTSFDATDNLTIVLPLYGEMLENSKVEEIVIELERIKE